LRRASAGAAARTCPRPETRFRRRARRAPAAPAADDFGLRDAARDRDGHVAAGARGFTLEDAQAAELGIDLLGGLLADVAGVEDDEIGVLGRCGLDVPLAAQKVRHTIGIVDVHLAAVGFDVELPVLHRPLGVGRPRLTLTYSIN
jgi:hypothetical protein